MDSRIQRELDRSDMKIIFLRSFADKLRLHQTAAEAKMQSVLGTEFWLQVPLLNCVLDFFHPTELIDVEIDGKQHLAYPRRDANRAYRLYEQLGIYTIRFLSDDVIRDVDSCVARLRDFRNNPVPPTKWIDDPGDLERKQQRVNMLKEIRSRVSSFENNMIGKTRREVILAFERLQPQDDLDLEVFARLSKNVYHWPEDGYISPGLQTFTARKKSRERWES